MKTDWDLFMPDIYIRSNYSTIHDEDKAIILRLLRFYKMLPKLEYALEIGVGPNLYPVMAMLPYIKKVVCMDISDTNIHYLTNQIKKPDENWLLFWDMFNKFNSIFNDNLNKILKEKIIVQKGNITI